LRHDVVSALQIAPSIQRLDGRDIICCPVEAVGFFSIVDRTYQQGDRKFLTVMVKDSQKYAATGGWGVQAWPGGDATKPIVNDAVKQCFGCHVPKQANDYVFSTYLH
jgi:hypothetical protein